MIRRKLRQRKKHADNEGRKGGHFGRLIFIMKLNINNNVYNRIPKAVKLQKGDRIRCKDFEFMIVTMKKLAYLGYSYRQNEPFMILIEEVPDEKV